MNLGTITDGFQIDQKLVNVHRAKPMVDQETKFACISVPDNLLSSSLCPVAEHKDSWVL